MGRVKSVSGLADTWGYFHRPTLRKTRAIDLLLCMLHPGIPEICKSTLKHSTRYRAQGTIDSFELDCESKSCYQHADGPGFYKEG